MYIPVTYQCWGCGSEKVKYEKAKKEEESVPSKLVWNLCPNCKRKEVVQMKAYCMKCKKSREMKNPTRVTLKNGRKAMKGVCPVCGTKMFRIGA